ncbi:uncharacterized protein LOC125812416 [Solanum verrucosum]|uniref:uncharacterized protein LOC125812416 n=1 Tax=Solanum verrucosum TaxID=315347 RepID=UPI0020D12C4B|nr:uncharacterized protein LOC125812416 [Solanum verrucosum]
MEHLKRSWMYKRLDGRGALNSSFIAGVNDFLKFAFSHPNRMSGFVENYFVWKYQGEKEVIGEMSIDLPNDTQSGLGYDNPYRQMVLDAVGSNFGQGSSLKSYSNDEPESSHHCEPPMEEDPNPSMEEEPNPESQRFYDLLQAADAELYPGSSISQLALVSRMLNIKMENTLSQRGYNQVMQLLKEALPEDNQVLDSYYQTKKLVRSLGLPVEKIDCCNSGCMLYWEDDKDLTSCKFCGYERFKRRVGSRKRKLVPYKKMYYFPLIPRLRRLYASHATAADMRWHQEHTQEEGVMRHPSDSEAWKHFNETHPFFASDPRNVRLGLCTDGFQPFAQSGRKYSSWPVIVTPYNLPPGMCMKEAYMFLTVIVPGPHNPKQKIDVYLQPLIKELTLLWETGVEAFDISKKQNFQLRAALMWTINDFPAYSMLSGWSTSGNLACPYCMEETQSFRLQYGVKTTWFDNHRMFIDQNHPFRSDRKNFLKGHIVTRLPPPLRSGQEILNQICELGIRKVTELDAEEVNKRICKSCGWKKRSIFWDLPYWSSNMIRHNLDVMHIEKNVFDNVFNTVLEVDGKTKDNPKACLDVVKYCNRPHLARNPDGSYPKAAYTINKD